VRERAVLADHQEGRGRRRLYVADMVPANCTPVKEERRKKGKGALK